MEKSHLAPLLGMTLLLLIFGYGLGEGILRAMRAGASERYFRAFLALTTGLTAVVGGYAIVVTHGLTVLLPVLALLAMALTGLRVRPTALVPDQPAADAEAGNPVAQEPGGSVWATALGALAVATGLFAVRVGLLYDAASPYLLTPFQDYIYYGRVSAALNQSGREIRSLEQFFPQFVHPQPYHYYELWLSALVVRLSGLPAVWCLYLVTYSVLTTVVYLGLRAVLAHFAWRGLWAVALALALLLVSGVYWPPFEHLAFAQAGRYVATSLLLLEPKLSGVYIFLLLGILLALQRQWRAVGAVFAVLPLVFFTTVPAVAGTLVALGALGWWRFGKGHFVGLLAPFGLALAYLGVFYGLQPAAFEFPASPWGSPLAKLPQVAGWHTMLNIFVGTLLNIGLYCGAYGGLVLLVGWGRFRRTWQRWPYALVVVASVLASSVLAGAVAYTLAARFQNSYQLLGNVLPPLLPIALGAGLAALLGGSNTGVRRAVAIAGLLALAGVNYRRLATHNHSMHEVTRFSPVFLRQVQQALGTTGKRGGFVMADPEYKTAYNTHPDTFTRGTYVADFLNDYALVSLSALDVDSLSTDPRFAADTVLARENTWASSFVRFVKLNARKARPWPKDSAQYQFVKQYHIGFVCVGPGASLPGTLKPLVRQQYQDPLSGEKFYALH